MALSTDLIDYWPLTGNTLVGAVNGLTWGALNLSYEAASPGPCWRRDSPAGGYLQISGIDITPPFTLAVMCYSVSSSDAEIFTYTKNGNDNNHRLYRTAVNNLSARTRSGGVAGETNSGGLPGNQFNNVAGVWASDASRRSYIAGTLSSPDTTNLPLTGSANVLALGAAFDGSTIHHGSPENFRFKHAAAWRRTLDQAELDSYFANPGQLLPSSGFTIAADGGSYLLSGVAADLRIARRITAEAGSYIWTGAEANLTKQTPGAYVLVAESGTYVWTGVDAYRDLSFNAESGTYNFVGQSVDLIRTFPQSYILVADSGSYIWSGKPAALRWSGAPVNLQVYNKISVGIKVGL